MKFLSAVGFKSSTLTAYLICTSKTEGIFNFVCPLWIQSYIKVSGTQIYYNLFLASSTKS